MFIFRVFLILHIVDIQSNSQENFFPKNCKSTLIVNELENDFQFEGRDTYYESKTNSNLKKN